VAAQSDMGGRTEFFGPVVREPNEPVFHEPWEGRLFGLSWFLIPLIRGQVDAVRDAQERLPREVYLSGYYRRWLAGFETLLVESGYLGPDELDARVAGFSTAAGPRRTSRARRALMSWALRMMTRPVLPRWLAAHVLPLALGGARPTLQRPRFSVSEHVRVRAEQAPGHTRQPGYVTGKPGEIVAHLGSHVFPDAHAVGRRAWPQYLYTVAFESDDLWGDAAEPGTEVLVDLFESYLEPM
jgi:nitrile hydratase subunit beta